MDQTTKLAILYDNKLAPFLWVILLQAIAIALADLGGDTEQSALYVTRWSARAGFPIFLIAFSASAIYRISRHSISASIMKHRRQWGLAFAFSHAVHFIFILYFLRVNDMAISIENLGAGLIPYSFIVLMALTSNNASMRLLGRNWKRLHWIGSYSIWIGYASSYLGRMIESETFWIGIIGTLLSFAVIGLRIAAHYKNRKA